MPSKVIKANSMNETVLMKTEVALKAVITKQGSDMKISGKVISNCLVEPSVSIQPVCQQSMQMDTRH